MSNLVPFNFENKFEINTVIKDEVVHFHARAIASVLNYVNVSDAYQKHCKSLILFSYSELLELNFPNPNPRGEYFILEPDVYRLITKCSKSTPDLKKRFISFLKENKLISENFIFVFEPRKEINFFKSLKDFLVPFNIEIKTQFNCHKYKIDCYIKDLDLVIEYDENFHKYYDHKSEQTREEFIKNKLKCNIIRISDKYSDATNLGIIINKLIKKA